MTNQTTTLGTIVGSFSKGIPGSVAVNFSESGGKHCDHTCTLKGQGCYAITQTNRKPSIRVNGLRHEADPEGFASALTEPKTLDKIVSAPWVRFSAFGAFWRPSAITPVIEQAMRDLAAALARAGTPVHFPTETREKARMLRSFGFSPRVSCGTAHGRLRKILEEGFTASLVVAGPKKAIGKNKREHAAPAFAKAQKLREKGLTAKVCPAIAGNAKCGKCTLCADEKIQVVIYPGH